MGGCTSAQLDCEERNWILSSCQGIDFESCRNGAHSTLPLCRRPARSEAERHKKILLLSLRPLVSAPACGSKGMRVPCHFGTTRSRCPDTNQCKNNFSAVRNNRVSQASVEQLFLPQLLSRKCRIKRKQPQSRCAGINENRRTDEPVGEVGGHWGVQHKICHEGGGCQADEPEPY